MGNVLIIGLGNSLRSDDGAGEEAALWLKEIYSKHAGVRVLQAQP